MTLAILLVAFMTMLGACGGGNDTVLTGFSGVIIFGLVAWIVIHFVRKRR